MIYFTSDLHLGHEAVIRMQNRHISLMHYPMLSWPRSHHGSIMLHGHIHADATYNLQNREEGIKRYDVGVDANNYMPVSMKQIEKFFDGGNAV